MRREDWDAVIEARDSSIYPHEDVCFDATFEYSGNSAYDRLKTGFLESLARASLGSGIASVALTTKRFLCMRKPNLQPIFQNSVPWRDIVKLDFEIDALARLTTLRIGLKNKHWIDLSVTGLMGGESYQRLDKLRREMNNLLRMAE